MNVPKLTGGTAAGAALVVFFTHGADYTLEEIAALTAGAGAAITYLITMLERMFPVMEGEE